MIKKYYIAELTEKQDEKQLVGSILVDVWFWQSPLFAFEKAKGRAVMWALINFRRIK